MAFLQITKKEIKVYLSICYNTVKKWVRNIVYNFEKSQHIQIYSDAQILEWEVSFFLYLSGLYNISTKMH